MKMATPYLMEMNWMEVKKAIKDSGGIAIIPIGSLETWAHMPVGSDCYQAMGHLKRVVALAEKDPEIKQLLVLPFQYIGHVFGLSDFPGTISVRYDVMREYFRDIAEAMIRHGVLKLIWLSGHQGSNVPIIEVARQLKEKYGVLSVIDRGYLTAGEDKGPLPPGAPRRGHGSGGQPLCEIPREILKRVLPKAKTWLTEGRTIQGWGTDDFTDATWYHDMALISAKLKTSLDRRGDPMRVWMVGHWQETFPYGGSGDALTMKELDKAVEEASEGADVAARHTIAIIKAISKIKVPLKTPGPREDIENL